jgi:hypothetical protein
MDSVIVSITGTLVGILMIVGAAAESMNNTHMKDTTPDDRVFVLDGPDVQERIEEKCLDDLGPYMNLTEEMKECMHRIRN